MFKGAALLLSCDSHLHEKAIFQGPSVSLMTLDIDIDIVDIGTDDQTCLVLL